MGSITGTLCAYSSRDMTLLALEICNPEVALGGLGGQGLVWQEEMRFPTDLEAKEAFLEGDNQKMGPLSGTRRLLAAESSAFLCHCSLLGGGEDLSPPWRCCRARRAVTGFGAADGGRRIFLQRQSLSLCCRSLGHGASRSEPPWSWLVLGWRSW